MNTLSGLLAVTLLVNAAGAGPRPAGSQNAAEGPGQAASAQPAATGETPAQEELFKKFTQTLSGVKLVGRFTILGQDDGPLPKEEYTIHSVKKLPEGDYWQFNARIKYGEHDVTLPLKLQVKWAGDTPVITLTELTIPLLGTFSSRVVIDDDKYAGTWAHDKVGGHLFGTIEKLPTDKKEDKSAAPEKSDK